MVKISLSWFVGVIKQSSLPSVLEKWIAWFVKNSWFFFLPYLNERVHFIAMHLHLTLSSFDKNFNCYSSWRYTYYYPSILSTSFLFFFFYVFPSGCRMMDLEDLIADIKYTYTQSYCKSAIENLVPGTYIPIWIFRQKVSQNYSTNRQCNKANRKQQSIATKIR